MDAAPDLAVVAEIPAMAASVPDLRGVEKCFIRKMGWQLHVDTHVKVDGQLTVERAHAIAHQVKDHLRAELVRIEPARMPDL